MTATPNKAVNPSGGSGGFGNRSFLAAAGLPSSFGHKQQKSLPLNQIDELLRALAQTPGCSLLPPQGLPTLPAGMQLPDDLRAFYEHAGGAVLYADHVCAGHQ